MQDPRRVRIIGAAAATNLDDREFDDLPVHLEVKRIPRTVQIIVQDHNHTALRAQQHRVDRVAPPTVVSGLEPQWRRRTSAVELPRQPVSEKNLQRAVVHGISDELRILDPNLVDDWLRGHTILQGVDCCALRLMCAETLLVFPQAHRNLCVVR